MDPDGCKILASPSLQSNSAEATSILSRRNETAPHLSIMDESLTTTSVTSDMEHEACSTPSLKLKAPPTIGLMPVCIPGCVPVFFKVLPCLVSL